MLMNGQKVDNLRRDIIVFTTGGTIEKSYDEFDGSLSNRESIIKNKILGKMRLPYNKVDIREILSLDSLEMCDEDREKILVSVKEVLGEGKPIIILHGTDTMEITARYIWKGIKHDKLWVPVIFTGAMRPLGFDDSDATQNFVEAIMASYLAMPGIYISFHGRLFEAPHVIKNREMGTFAFKEYTD